MDFRKNSVATFILLVMLFSMLSSCTYAINNTENGANDEPAIIYVSPDGNDNWNGLAPKWDKTTGNGPKKTIKSALSQIDYGGTIRLAPGMYHENNIQLDVSVIIEGSGANSTHIDGKRGQVFYITADGQDGGNVIFKDFTMENAQSRNVSSAIYNWLNCELTIQNCNFKNNRRGGVIDNDGYVLIENCNFDSNNALYSGGAIINNGEMVIKDSDFSLNYAYKGGAIWNLDNLKIENCAFSDNSVGDEMFPDDEQSGGAIYNEGALDIKNSDLTSNFAVAGGGAIFSVDSLYIENCNFQSNIAGQGGAVFTSGNYLIIDNNRFTDNTASSYGGAICKTAIGSLGNNKFKNNAPDNVKIIQS